MEGATKIIMYLIPIIVFVLLVMYFFAPSSGVFEKFQGAGEKASAFLPNISVGADKLKASTPGVDSVHKQEILKLKNTIESMKGKKGPCFANYGGFTDLGEYGTSLQLTANNNGGTDFTVLGGKGGKQVVTDLGFTIQGVNPCVIAGNSEVVKNFNDLYLNDKSWEEKSKQFGVEHYTLVNGITIKYSTSKVHSNGNRIGVSSFPDNVVNDVYNNFNEGGYLYTKNGKDICFFPTVLGNNICDGSDKDGLDDDCLIDQTEDISIPRQLKEGKLKQCS